jgi:hypothetical protein
MFDDQTDAKSLELNSMVLAAEIFKLKERQATLRVRNYFFVRSLFLLVPFQNHDEGIDFIPIHVTTGPP